LDQGLLTTLGRRSAQRIGTHLDVGIADESTGERLLGQLRDLSSAGACVATRFALPVGRFVRIAFDLEPGGEPARLRAEVVWCRRAESRHGGVLAGVRFVDAEEAELARLRAFIEKRLWAVQRLVCTLDLFADMSDIEKLLLASVACDRELKAGETLDDAAGENALIVALSGTMRCEERTADGRVLAPRELAAGDVCGALPIDPRGGSIVTLRAITDGSVLIVPGNGFWYLATVHAETALKLLSCWCLSLRDRFFAVEPAA
jgi:hypothetical protein